MLSLILRLFLIFKTRHYFSRFRSGLLKVVGDNLGPFMHSCKVYARRAATDMDRFTRYSQLLHGNCEQNVLFIAVKGDLPNKKTTIFLQCLCKIFISESVLKQSRYIKRFKRCCTIKILHYKFVNRQVLPASFSLSVRPSEGAR